MTSRAGFAFHNEFSWFRERGGAPDGTDLSSSSLMLDLILHSEKCESGPREISHVPFEEISQ